MKTVFSSLEVWAISYNGIYDISKIYLNKEDAEKEAAEQNKLARKILRKDDSYVRYFVKSLDDVMEDIKQRAIDNMIDLD